MLPIKSLQEIYNIKNRIGFWCDEYNEYIELHRANVMKAFEEHMLPYLENVYDASHIVSLRNQLKEHDLSKYDKEEYDAYAHKFYPSGSMTEESIRSEFAYAWLHHLHNNKHHSQYWYIRNDTDHEDDRPLDMPLDYIIEMLCDWGSFYYMNEEKKPGINTNSTAHMWWDEHNKDFSLSLKTVSIIEDLLKNCPEV